MENITMLTLEDIIAIKMSKHLYGLEIEDGQWCAASLKLDDQGMHFHEIGDTISYAIAHMEMKCEDYKRQLEENKK